MSMCRVFSCVVGREYLLWPVHFLGKTLLVFALLHSAFQGQICLLLRPSFPQSQCLLSGSFRKPLFIIHQKADEWEPQSQKTNPTLLCHDKGPSSQRYWGRLVRVPWTTRRPNQSILEEISPEYSLEGLMLKLKLQYFGHLRWRGDSLERTLMLGKIEGRRRRRGRWDGWMPSLT